MARWLRSAMKMGWSVKPSAIFGDRSTSRYQHQWNANGGTICFGRDDTTMRPSWHKDCTLMGGLTADQQIWHMKGRTDIGLDQWCVTLLWLSAWVIISEIYDIRRCPIGHIYLLIICKYININIKYEYIYLLVLLRDLNDASYLCFYWNARDMPGMSWVLTRFFPVTGIVEWASNQTSTYSILFGMSEYWRHFNYKMKLVLV